MNRRKFFAFLPVAPLALVAEGARAVTADGAPIQESLKIVLNGAKKKEPAKVVSKGLSWNVTFAGANDDPNKQISMAVGDDGDLWLKRTDGEWRKVVTE
jgi:hypothetical protein